LETASQTLRRLRRDWVFTVAFVVTLALGIAANAAVFSALDAYFLRPLPYPDGQRLVDIYFDAAKYSFPRGYVSAPGYERLRSVSAISSSGLLGGEGNLTVAIPGEPPANHRVAMVTASALETLGVRPLLGRWISPAADRLGGPSEVDVSYGFWLNALHGDPHVLGRSLRVSGKQYTVVGVMPSGFDFPFRHTQLWTPIALTPAALDPRNLMEFDRVMIARLRPGVSAEQLQAQIQAVLDHLQQTMPPAKRLASRRIGLYVASMGWREWLGGATRGRLLMMQLGAGILLLLAAASLVNLALARALRRRDEAALRVVLGAGRPALVAQALLEALPLAVAATLIAWPLTALGMRALTQYGIASASTTFQLHLGGGLWVLALALALLLSAAALAFPQALVSVSRPAELLYGTGKGGSHRTRPLRLALSVGQIGLAIALLAGALLLGRSLRNMLDSGPGFDTRHLYAATLDLQGPQYQKWGAWLDAHQRLAAAVAALPGVQASGVGEEVPFTSGGAGSSFSPAQHRAGGARYVMGAITIAGPGLMKTLRLHLLAGRLLDASDAAANAANIVIDRRIAEALFGRAAVVGKSLNCGLGTCRIVGVVGTIHDRFAPHFASARGTVFLAEEPHTFRSSGGITTILIRSAAPAPVLSREVSKAMHRILPDQSLIAFAPMRERIRHAARGAAALASLLIAFGLLAFTLAVIGTYGVVAYVTGLRRQEFAIRQAVGAEPAEIESLVLRQGLLLWALGALVGIACALIFARGLAAQLYRVSLLSPVTYGFPAAIVGAAVFLASWIPARGARKLDLIAQVRAE
jgi:predicted permease